MMMTRPPALPYSPREANNHLQYSFRTARNRMVAAYGRGGHPGIIGLDNFGSWMEDNFNIFATLHRDNVLEPVTIDCALDACRDMLAVHTLPPDSWIQWVALIRHHINPFTRYFDYPYDVQHLIEDGNSNAQASTGVYEDEYGRYGGGRSPSPDSDMPSIIRAYYPP
ncbi:hypothetical protein I350_02080 [Cryptococcus amylolentus CBS 6273]|uniref:Uncharacterized protein n=1 Tax=Cryptococcus amylolentus CBS 6273 TaxID=1296118 RepID=A0A1E3K9S4_9TREE|nr:hypothetical protein I350_02080 [Cryptococcus amylolentus CBS 6273]